MRKSPARDRFRVRALVALAAPLCAAMAAAQTLGVLKAFSSEGKFPRARLVMAADAYLYGTTFSGGAADFGTIFRLDVNGSAPPATVHHFTGADGSNPVAGLIVGSDGALYGTTSNGPSAGTAFRFDPATATLTTLHAFHGADGMSPRAELAQGPDGRLYGTTFSGGPNDVGTIFRVGVDGTGFETLHAFSLAEGYYPEAGLVCARDGFLYGATTTGGAHGVGTLFKMDRGGASLVTLHGFAGSDGQGPVSALVQARDGNLYGVAGGGGASGGGTLFRIDTAGILFTKLHDFGGAGGQIPQGSLIVGADIRLYGETQYGGDVTSSGTVYRIETGGGGFTVIHAFVNTDGAHPYGGVVQTPDGRLYGTTNAGLSQYGTVFTVGDDASGFATLHAFGPYPEGREPRGELVRGADGYLYGTTSNNGGTFGTIFRMGSAGGSFETVHRFGWTDGSYPHTALVSGADGALYGTTYSGGGSGNTGTVFKLDPVSLALTTLHIFGPGDGAGPDAALIQALDGNLYGTTSGNTVFKVGTDGSGFTVLHTFAGADGIQPRGRLLQASDGMLYGTTTFGGANGQGSVFRIATNGTSFSTLHHFAGADGANPYAGLIQGIDGDLYGTTWVGGTSSVGTVFRMDTAGSNLTTLHHFATSDGAGPYAVIQGSDGYLYGTTSVGGLPSCASGCGTVFRIGVDGTGFETFHAFVASEGAQPESGVLEAADGTLYGTTAFGGAAGGGTVYRLASCGSNARPVITPGGATTFCSGGSVSLDAGSGYSSYYWIPNGETTPSIIVAAPGSYSVNATDAAGCGGTSTPVAVTVNANPSPVVTADWCVPAGTGGLSASTPEDPSHTYDWTITGGTIDSGQGTNAITFTSSGPGTAILLSVAEVNASGCGKLAEAVLQADFADVPPADPFHAFVCAVGRAGITVGCGSGDYCRNNPVSRAQMAVFLLKAEHGGAYTPPPCTGVFIDVPCPGPFSDWIERLFAEGITGGCGPQQYCPGNPVTRAQMAVFLLKTSLGSAYAPPPCTGAVFLDVPCAGGAFDPWIEDVAARRITGGCGGGDYCPGSPNTRGQMAVFLAKTFDTSP